MSGSLQRAGVLLREGEAAGVLKDVQALLSERGIDIETLGWDEPPVEGLDLVIAMGGDGTVLKALELCRDCPVLAINFGTVGFLTAGDRNDLEEIVSKLVAGDYLVSERMALACRYPAGEIRAVNEVMVRSSNRLGFTDVFIDGTKIRTIVGDGVVVGTPTGSTAFLLSAGAPIVMPDVRCLILDGINEHNFTSRTLIIPPDSEIRLHISPETREPEVYLTSDGRQLVKLSPGDDIHIRRAETTAKLIYFEPDYFFHNLSSKLRW